MTNSCYFLPLGQTKNWIALEDSLQRCNDPDEIKSNIASSAVHHPSSFFDDKNVFAIYVSYYVKVKLTLSGMGGELSLKLPFILAHFDDRLASPGSVPSPIDSSQPNESRDTVDDVAERRGIGGTKETTKKKSIIIEKNSQSTTSSSSSSGRVTNERATTTAKGQVSFETNDKHGIDIAKHPRGSAPEGGPTVNLSVLRQRRFSQARQERIRPEEEEDRIETLSDDGEVLKFRTEPLENDNERGIEFQSNSETIERQEQHEKRALVESSSPVVMVVVGSGSVDVDVEQKQTRLFHSTDEAKAEEDERKSSRKDREVPTTCTTLVQIHAPQS